jgi:hypothetical protein
MDDNQCLCGRGEVTQTGTCEHCNEEFLEWSCDNVQAVIDLTDVIDDECQGICELTQVVDDLPVYQLSLRGSEPDGHHVDIILTRKLWERLDEFVRQHIDRYDC